MDCTATSEEIEKTRSVAWIPYWSLVFGIVILLLFPKNSFVKHHFGQAVVLFAMKLFTLLFYLAAIVVWFIVSFIAFGVSEVGSGPDASLLLVKLVVNGLFSLVLMLVSLVVIAMLVITVIGTVYAIQGRCWVIPLVGKVALRFTSSPEPESGKN